MRKPSPEPDRAQDGASASPSLNVLRRTRVVFLPSATALGADRLVSRRPHTRPDRALRRTVSARCRPLVVSPRESTRPPPPTASTCASGPSRGQSRCGRIVRHVAISYGLLGWLSNKTGHVGQPFAPMYTYSQIVVKDSDGNEMGSYPSDALQLAVEQGSDTKAHYSHDDFDWHTTPSDDERANAAHHKASGYTSCLPVRAERQRERAQARSPTNTPSRSRSTCAGFDNMGSSPDAVDTDYTNAWRGFHEVLAVGYDEAGLIIQNSWSTYWGFSGFGRLSWAVVQHDVMEADTIEGFAAPSPPTVTTPTATMLATGTTAAGTFPYKVEWKGTAGTSARDHRIRGRLQA